MNRHNIELGDFAYMKKEHHTWTEWILFIVNDTYLALIEEFPEDYKPF